MCAWDEERLWSPPPAEMPSSIDSLLSWLSLLLDLLKYPLALKLTNNKPPLLPWPLLFQQNRDRCVHRCPSMGLTALLPSLCCKGLPGASGLALTSCYLSLSVFIALTWQWPYLESFLPPPHPDTPIVHFLQLCDRVLPKRKCHQTRACSWLSSVTEFSWVHHKYFC